MNELYFTNQYNGIHINNLIYNNPIIILQVDLYLIHYNGWSQKWDEWIPETRILKFNEVNLKVIVILIVNHIL